MTIDEMFDKLWTSYPSDLCRKKRGGRQPAIKAFKKINPSVEEFGRMMANMRAQIKEDRKEKEPYRWPFVSSYLNQGRYDDYIEPTQTEIKQDVKKCTHDGCFNDVVGNSFAFCSQHIPCQHDIRLREAWKHTGINRNSPTLRADCMKYIKERGFTL